MFGHTIQYFFFSYSVLFICINHLEKAGHEKIPSDFVVVVVVVFLLFCLFAFCFLLICIALIFLLH